MTEFANLLVTETFLNLISKTKSKPKQQALQKKLDELSLIKGNNSGVLIVNNLIASLRPCIFSEAIDNQAKTGWFAKKTNPTQTRSRKKLDQLVVQLNAMNTYAFSACKLDIGTYLLIQSAFTESLDRLGSKSPPKTEALRTLRVQLLAVPDREAAKTLLYNSLNSGPFITAIRAQRGAISFFNPLVTETVTEMHCLYNNLVKLGAGGGLKNWMADFPDDIKLGNITMPGSHDAGVYDDPTDPSNKPASKGGPDSMGVCHSLSIYNQACAGVRYFDIRVQNNSGNWQAVHATMGVGTWGAKATKILEDMILFLDENATEVLFYKCTHTTDKAYIEWMIRKLGNKLFTKINTNRLLTDVQLHRVRGKIILLIENDAHFIEMDLQGNNLFPFSNIKGDDEDGYRDNIEFTDTVIFGGSTGSDYVNDIIEGQIKKSDRVLQLRSEAYNHKNIFFQMSFTKMVGDVRARTKFVRYFPGVIGYDVGPHIMLPFLIDYLRTGDRPLAVGDQLQLPTISEPNNPLRYPNFVHLDDSSEETSNAIISLNEKLFTKYVVPTIIVRVLATVDAEQFEDG